MKFNSTSASHVLRGNSKCGASGNRVDTRINGGKILRIAAEGEIHIDENNTHEVA